MLLACAGFAAAAELQTLVIGDTLSEEYAYMIAGGGPYYSYQFASPESVPWQANTLNWVEMVGQWRGAGSGEDHLFLGVNVENWYLDIYEDLRRAGYALNFGLVDFWTATWVSTLLADEDSGILWDTVNHLVGALPTTEVVVIMLGWEDLRADYIWIHDDTAPAWIYDGIVDRLMWLGDYFDGFTGTIPVVMCTVPDIGVTPMMRASYPDPAKRAGARARIQAMNDDLRTRALAAGYGIADVHAITLRIEDDDPFLINGQELIADGHPENPPEYLFCRDDLHPATVIQALIANEVIGAINGLLGSSVEPFTNREILERVPGLDPDGPFLDWIAGHDVSDRGLHDNPDGDPFDNLAEFAFGLDPVVPDPGLAHDWSGPGGGRLGILWALAPEASGYLEVGAEQSADLEFWTPLAPGSIEDLGGGHWRASIDTSDPAGFLRATVFPAP